MPKVVYVKKANCYEDIMTSKKCLSFSKIIFKFKSVFRCIIKKKIENKEVWILPILKKDDNTSFTKYIQKFKQFPDNKYVFSKDIMTKENLKLLKKHELCYFNGNVLKRFLILDILHYILTIQKKKLEETAITVVVQNTSIENEMFIQKLIHTAKSVKIVSPNLYTFKQLEEKVYEKEGIALQLSNSYRKSLTKSKIIINLDTNAIDMNSYHINPRAIIIHCEKEPLLIRNKTFNGVVINSCNIEWEGENKEYVNLAFYESLLEGSSYKKIFEKIKNDKVKITSLIGNHGQISSKEFENLK